MRYTEESFTNFLKSVDLQKHKEQYSKIKIVEMDLPRNVQALDTIYDVYWNKNCLNGQNDKAPLSFDDFYDVYYTALRTNIEEFWGKTGFEKSVRVLIKG